MKKIKFSVLMSVYYKENPDYLKIALNSILNQTLRPNEIVLVEDGPLTDSLYETINLFKKKTDLLKIVPLKKNGGLGKALNEGIKYCKYEYIARMDTDDFSLPNRFSTQIGYLEKHPEVDVIGSNINEYDESLENLISIKKVPESNYEIYKYIKKRNPFNHMSVVFKKSKVIEAGNYIDCTLFEDYYLWCRMANNNCIFYNIQDSLLNVRAGLNMVERRGGLAYIKNIVNFQKKIKDLGIINNTIFLKNIIVRSLVAFSPKKVRLFFYKKKLR